MAALAVTSNRRYAVCPLLYAFMVPTMIGFSNNKAGCFTTKNNIAFILIIKPQDIRMVLGFTYIAGNWIHYTNPATNIANSRLKHFFL